MNKLILATLIFVSNATWMPQSLRDLAFKELMRGAEESLGDDIPY